MVTVQFSHLSITCLHYRSALSSSLTDKLTNSPRISLVCIESVSVMRALCLLSLVTPVIAGSILRSLLLSLTVGVDIHHLAVRVVVCPGHKKKATTNCSNALPALPNCNFLPIIHLKQIIIKKKTCFWHACNFCSFYYNIWLHPGFRICCKWCF